MIFKILQIPLDLILSNTLLSFKTDTRPQGLDKLQREGTGPSTGQHSETGAVLGQAQRMPVEMQGQVEVWPWRGTAVFRVSIGGLRCGSGLRQVWLGPSSSVILTNAVWKKAGPEGTKIPGDLRALK